MNLPHLTPPSLSLVGGYMRGEEDARPIAPPLGCSSRALSLSARVVPPPTVDRPTEFVGRIYGGKSYDESGPHCDRSSTVASSARTWWNIPPRYETAKG